MRENQEKDIRYDLVGKYKFRSIFVRILSFLLIYSFILPVALSLYNNYIVQKNVAQRLELRTLGILEKTQHSIDREFQNLSNQIVQLSKDEYIIAEMTAPNIKNASRNYDIVYQLQAVKLGNDLVSEAFLYIPTDDTFFSSEGAAVCASEYTEQSNAGSLIEKCREMGNDAGKQALITIKDVQYLLLNAPYFYDRVLGVLAFQIDSAYLNTIIEGESSPETDNIIWTYDEQGTPIFEKYLTYPEYLSPEAVTNMPTSTSKNRDKNPDYYKRVSGINGWQYLLSTDSDLFMMEKAGLDKGLLFILLCLSVFCIIFSVYLSKSVYFPIQKVIGIVGPSGPGNAGNAKNELELLERRVSDTVTRNQEMDHFLQNIRPTMISDTFRNLLAGHEIEREKVDEIFTVLKTDFSTSLNYSMEIITLIPESKEFSDLECNILFHRIEQEILAFSRNRFLCSFVHMLWNGNLVVIMGISNDISVKQMSIWREEMNLQVRDLCGNYPVKCLIGISKYLVDISELYKVFTGVCRDMNYKIYLQNYETGEKRRDKSEVEKQFILRNLSGIKEKIDNGDDEEDSVWAEKLTFTLIEGKNTPEELKEFAVLWWEAVIDLLIPLNVFEKAELDEEKEKLFCVLNDKEEFLVRLKNFNEKVVKGMKSSSKKLKRRYVERARQYIEEHYSDTDLSLSAISDVLGISQSYLSSLFKKEMEINFIEYLNRYRIERSKLLLQMTEMTVEEVGFKTGFSSAKNFTRVFKKYTDTSPGAYREG